MQKLLITMLLGLATGALVSYASITMYKNSCEIIGNDQGQKWRECNL